MHTERCTEAVIPVTMFLSVLLLTKQYHILQYVGATTIVLGIVLDKAPAGKTAVALGKVTEASLPGDDSQRWSHGAGGWMVPRFWICKRVTGKMNNMT